MAYTHFIAEGEVTFKSLLFVPVNQKSEEFQKYGNQDEQIKLYVRRVFITNDFKGQFHDFFLKKEIGILHVAVAISRNFDNI